MGAPQLLDRAEQESEPVVIGLAAESSSADKSRAGHGPLPVVEYPATTTVGYTGDELGFLVELLSDTTIAHYEPLRIPLGQPGGVELLKAFLLKQLKLQAGTWGPDRPAPTRGWMVVEANRRVGACQLRPDGGGYLVGVSLLPEARNRGLGTAVFAALAAYGLGHPGAAHVAGEVEEDNAPSIRAIQKAGYHWMDRYQTTLENGRRTTASLFVA